MTRTLVDLLVGALAVVALVACAPPAPSPESPAAAPTTTDAVAPRLTVERLGLRDVPLVPLGLTPERQVAVPPVEQPGIVGFYRHGPRPGARGPAVILGHRNGAGRDGAFAKLDTVRAGDRITTDDQGRTATFRVTRTVRVAKERFPTAAVYGDTPGPELRLVTCGGAFDGENYVDNVIVWATLDGR